MAGREGFRASRRSFLNLASSLGALSVLDRETLNALGQDVPVQVSDFFNFQSKYEYSELMHLYGKQGNSPYAGSSAAPGTIPSTVFFYWDDQAKQLINPYNLKPDSKISAGNYELKANVYNFHPSSGDITKFWKDDTNNVQLTFTAQANDQFDEEFQWIVLSGMSMLGNDLKGKDKQSLSLPSNNALTSFPSSEKIIITNSEVSLTLGLAAQKKQSILNHFIAAFKTIVGSPMFGLIPMPKLASDTVTAISTLLSQISKDNSLTPVIKGKQVDFRLYDGSSTNPFVLKPGYWVIMDAVQARPLIDNKDSENIKKGILLDLPNQQYELVDSSSNQQSVDITYAVIRILIPPVKTSS